VQVLSIYLDKRPPNTSSPHSIALIECCRASFREEEALMTRLGGQIDPAHRERHQTVMRQLSDLRLGAPGSDRGRLLASLILIDRELIAHIADAALVSAEA
jgi:hemerythrin